MKSLMKLDSIEKKNYELNRVTFAKVKNISKKIILKKQLKLLKNEYKLLNK